MFSEQVMCSALNKNEIIVHLYTAGQLLNLQMSGRIILPLGYERVYLPLCKVADTLFHIQGDGMMEIMGHFLSDQCYFVICNVITKATFWLLYVGFYGDFRLCGDISRII